MLSIWVFILIKWAVVQFFFTERIFIDWKQKQTLLIVSLVSDHEESLICKYALFDFTYVVNVVNFKDFLIIDMRFLLAFLDNVYNESV